MYSVNGDCSVKKRGFVAPVTIKRRLSEELNDLRERGFARVILNGEVVGLDEAARLPKIANDASVRIVIDRLVAGQSAPRRLVDSLETGFKTGGGHCEVWWLGTNAESFPTRVTTTEKLSGSPWQVWTFVSDLRCPRCNLQFPEPEPRLFSFNSPLGACPTCEGFGNLLDVDPDLIVPDPTKTIRDGAIACWNTPAYEHELQELLALADEYQLPVDVPYQELTDEPRKLIREGIPERNFGGLNGFFAWLEKHKYKVQVRAFASRWKSSRECPACHGARLNPLALAWKINGLNIAGIELDRKVLSELAIAEPAAFAAIVEKAKAALPKAA